MHQNMVQLVGTVFNIEINSGLLNSKYCEKNAHAILNIQHFTESYSWKSVGFG